MEATTINSRIIKNMANDNSKQLLANLIQCYEQSLLITRKLYSDEDLKNWAVINHSLALQSSIDDVKKKLKETFEIDYDSNDANKKIIKKGSKVKVLANHMQGMKGGTAIIKSYSLPANLSDVTMTDGMIMKDHKWMTNDEVKLK